jgi:ribosomal protein S18 acetylase RimI-like enzyme
MRNSNNKAMSEQTRADFSVRPLQPADHGTWRRLYQGYADFYAVPMTDAIADQVWNWLMDGNAALKGYVAEVKDTREVIGIAHVRPYPRSLSGSWAGFLDDLYVDPAHRHRGAGRALMTAVAAHGRAAGWSFVRWMTADDNSTAQRLYDRIASRTRWVTYQLDPKSLS